MTNAATWSATRGSTPGRPRRRVGGLWGLGAALMGVVTALFAWLSTSELIDVRAAAMWAGLSLASFAIVMMCLLALRAGTGVRLGRWELGPWTLVWVTIAFGLATVTWYTPAEGSAARISVSNVAPAVWLLMAATAVWTAGYLSGPPALLLRPAQRAMSTMARHRLPQIRSSWTPWLLFGIALVARAVSTATTGSFGYVGDAGSGLLALSGYRQLFTVLGLFAPLAVAAAAIQVFGEGRRSARFTLAVLFLTEILLGALAGGKQSFIVAVLAVLIPFGAARLRVPRLAVLTAAVVFLILVVPFNQSYRTTVRGDDSLSVAQSVAAAPQVLDEALRIASTPGTLSESFGYFLTRVRLIDVPALILQRTPDEIAYRSVNEILVGPAIGLVPRAIWPGKPVLNSGYQFAQTYYGTSDAFSSSAITPQGDLYRHGGWLVLLIGMTFLGLLTRLLDAVFNVSRNPHAIFFVLLLFPTFVKMEIDMVSLLASLPATLLTATLAVYVAFQPRT